MRLRLPFFGRETITNNPCDPLPTRSMFSEIFNTKYRIFAIHLCTSLLGLYNVYIIQPCSFVFFPLYIACRCFNDMLPSFSSVENRHYAWLYGLQNCAEYRSWWSWKSITVERFKIRVIKWETNKCSRLYYTCLGFFFLFLVDFNFWIPFSIITINTNLKCILGKK